MTIKIDTSDLPKDARIFIISEIEYTRHLLTEEPIDSFKHINLPIRHYDTETEFNETIIVRVRHHDYMPYETTTKANIKPVLIKETVYDIKPKRKKINDRQKTTI